MKAFLNSGKLTVRKFGSRRGIELKIVCVCFICLILGGCTQVGNEVTSYQDPNTVEYEIEGASHSEEEVQEAVELIERNLAYAQRKEMDNYLSTIVSQAHEETKRELEPIFEEYTLEHIILHVEVLEKEADRMLIQTEQQTVVLDSAEGTDEYRDHISEANYTLVKENNQWKIQETVMTNTVFIK